MDQMKATVPDFEGKGLRYGVLVEYVGDYSLK